MAFDFTPERPVLNFGPRHHARWSSREFLLWPAWAYRVVAPRIRERKLNVLQRAVIGLCRAGVLRIDAIADHLSIHRDLAALIVTELGDFGYLDPNRGLPTEQGLEALEEDALENQEMVTGYVFQDPWQGDLWPRFVESLDYCELEPAENGFSHLILGTKGKPKRQRAFTVLPHNNVTPAMPTATAIVQAVALHRKSLNKDIGDTDSIALDDEIVGDFVASGVEVSRVSFVGEEPQPVFLMTYLYVPESGAEAMDWYACDPFGLGQSPWLRYRIEKLMHDVSGLYSVIGRLVGHTLHADYKDQQRWLEAIQLKAGQEIDQRLTVDFRNHTAFQQMLDMESARQEMLQLGQDYPERKIDETLRAGLKVLEAVFSSLAKSHPLGDIWKRVYVSRFDRKTGRERLVQQQDRKVCAATYQGAFRSLGFADPVPDAFLNIRPGQIRSVAERNDHWRLRPLVTATALAAQTDPSHPLANAAKRSPRLLEAIEEIASAGAGAGHAQGDSPSAEEAEQYVDKVYDTVAILLGIDRPGSNPSIDTGNSHG